MSRPDVPESVPACGETRQDLLARAAASVEYCLNSPDKPAALRLLLGRFGDHVAAHPELVVPILKAAARYAKQVGQSAFVAAIVEHAYNAARPNRSLAGWGLRLVTRLTPTPP